LRHDSSALGLLRVTTEPVQLGGALIPAGARVYVAWGSANHDEAVFDHAEEFDIHRTDVGHHLGFGKGVHFCLGAPLGRLDTRIALELLLARLPDLRLAPGVPIPYAPSMSVRGPLRLEVEWSGAGPGS